MQIAPNNQIARKKNNATKFEKLAKQQHLSSEYI